MSRDPDSGSDGPERNLERRKRPGTALASFRPRAGRAQGRLRKPGADALRCTRAVVGSVILGLQQRGRALNGAPSAVAAALFLLEKGIYILALPLRLETVL